MVHVPPAWRQKWENWISYLGRVPDGARVTLSPVAEPRRPPSSWAFWQPPPPLRARKEALLNQEPQYRQHVKTRAKTYRSHAGRPT